ncbi:MAG: hypothetical protein RLZZ232_2310 [Planctomycetota bacterium]|jgi:hypothetical protein
MQHPQEHFDDSSPEPIDEFPNHGQPSAGFPGDSPPTPPRQSAPGRRDDPWQTPQAAGHRNAPQQRPPRKKQSALFVIATVVLATVVGVIVFAVTLLFTCVGLFAAVNDPGSPSDSLTPFTFMFPVITAIAAILLTGGIMLGLYSLFRK